jgi:uncharacterized protein (TIGR03083 family)
MTGEHPDELLEAFAFGDCPAPAARQVREHVATCERCAALTAHAAQAAGWLAVTHTAAPPAALRGRVLAAARAARPPAPASVTAASEPYAVQVAEMSSLLGGLSAEQWQTPVPGGRSVRDLVLHLAGNDRMVSTDLGDRPGPPAGEPAQVWRDGSDRLLRTVGSAGALSTPVRLAGKSPTPVRRPLREALVQRAFETWIHGDDIRTAIDLPTVPPAGDHLARIVSFALALLPGAMEAAGRAHPGRAVRLELTGPGGAGHLTPLSSRGGDPEVTAGVRLPAERFGRLLAGRVPVTATVAEITGDRAAALDMLAVAATLGCD